MTTTEGDTVSVRRATLSDFQSVMDISEGIYFGWDYLPYYYHVYLQDKRSNCFVVTSQDRVVSQIIWGVAGWRGSPDKIQYFADFAEKNA